VILSTTRIFVCPEPQDMRRGIGSWMTSPR